MLIGKQKKKIFKLNLKIIYFILFFRALYIQELLLGTVDKNSQNVITDTPTAVTMMSNTSEMSLTSEDQQPEAIAQGIMMMEIVDAEEQHGAQALQLQPVHHHHSGAGDAATAMKKSFIRKKEMTAVDGEGGGGKKQKSKVSNTRK